MSEGGLVIHVAGRNAGCASGVSVFTPARLGDVNFHFDPSPDGLNAHQDRRCSAAKTDTIRTEGGNTVRLAAVYFFNPGQRPGNPWIDFANSDPNGPIPFLGPNRLRDFDGKFELQVTSGMSQSAFPKPAAVLGVSTSIFALFCWKRRR